MTADISGKLSFDERLEGLTLSDTELGTIEEVITMFGHSLYTFGDFARGQAD
tara:strand:- start:120 stop:275 length:156 start_codon:yes stop_codon:yes gene_type:complete